MALKLMYITNHEKVARIADESGVDWIFIDLEINGKEERQGHLDTVISKHSLDDIVKVKQVLTRSELLVRVNPIFEGSKNEIDRAIRDGADIIMLPYFKTKDEVEKFITFVNGRVKTCLLCETVEAVKNIDTILTVQGIDYIHIGLNDLHLDYNMDFMFELLANDTVELLCNKFRHKRIPYGFGGIARLGYGDLPAENIIAEHYRLGSSLAILSRSFCNAQKEFNEKPISDIFKKGVEEIRNYEQELATKESDFFNKNRIHTLQRISEITHTLSK